MLCVSLPHGYIITDMNFPYDKYQTNYSYSSWFLPYPYLRERWAFFYSTAALNVLSRQFTGNTRRLLSPRCTITAIFGKSNCHQRSHTAD